MNKWVFCLLILFFGHGLFADFISPTKRLITADTLEEIKYNLKGKNTGLNYVDLFDKAIAEEHSGFIGYHGGGIDDLIYQDIVRAAVEEVAGIPIRKEFYFLSVPINDYTSLEHLSQLFVKEGYDERKILKNTFPLNFALYSNHNQSGLNSVVNFTHDRSTGEIDSLKQLFEQLGIDTGLVEMLYSIARQHLNAKGGVLLQIFDTSPSPYAFANTTAYGAFPNGFIEENRLISEYFLDNPASRFPHEVRLLLNLQGILNPHSPITVKRYTKLQPSKLKAWEQELREVLRSTPVDPQKQKAWRETLLEAWR